MNVPEDTESVRNYILGSVYEILTPVEDKQRLDLRHQESRKYSNPETVRLSVSIKIWASVLYGITHMPNTLMTLH